ncbi:hypothetical protein SISNIDRAFT_321385 [Sistotremastrum niveocremeum HHB9708]|uniref:Uncharacterized protein n=1 Tax=Sistotremastrum niveocremeum HHB9708 TaxID=1314777 RepID=A0A164MWE3_9AGAM|nr:hypothetical protein SISNIDRAFT_321385 [Sistotremastrum niveocremeum HHB9708]
MRRQTIPQYDKCGGCLSISKHVSWVSKHRYIRYRFRWIFFPSSPIHINAFVDIDSSNVQEVTPPCPTRAPEAIVPAPLSMPIVLHSTVVSGTESPFEVSAAPIAGLMSLTPFKRRSYEMSISTHPAPRCRPPMSVRRTQAN